MLTFLALLHRPVFAESPHHTQLSVVESTQTHRINYDLNQTVYGYLPYWSTAPENLDFYGLSHVAYFGVELNSDGSLSYESRWNDAAPSLVDRAHDANVKIHLCLISFSDNVNNTVLSSPSLREKTIQNLQRLIDDHGADGVNIDIEGMDASQRDNFNAFIAELSETIPEIVIATPAIDWSDAYDYQKLSQYADLFIMGYDYHWSGGDPGPVDPLFGGEPWGPYALDWTVDDYLSAGVPRSRIILGLPLYGRSWETVDDSVPGISTGTSDSITMAEANQIAQTDGMLFDVVTESPYILYANEQIWYPSIDSVESRLLWAQDEGLQGVGFWALGYETGLDGFWDMMLWHTEAELNAWDPEEDYRPTANAGPDQTVVLGSTVQLDGQQSTTGGPGTLTYAWSIDGDQEIFDATSSTASFEATEIGTWTVTLTVRHGTVSSMDSVDITVVEETKWISGCSSLPNHTPFWMLALYSIIPILRRRQSTIEF